MEIIIKFIVLYKRRLENYTAVTFIVGIINDTNNVSLLNTVRYYLFLNQFLKLVQLPIVFFIELDALI